MTQPQPRASMELALASVQRLHELTSWRVLAAVPGAARPPEEQVREALAVVFDECDAAGPEDCDGSQQWLVELARTGEHLVSVWAWMPSPIMVEALCARAMMANRRLLVIVTEDAYFSEWLDALGPGLLAAHVGRRDHTPSAGLELMQPPDHQGMWIGDTFPVPSASAGAPSDVTVH